MRNLPPTVNENLFHVTRGARDSQDAREAERHATHDDGMEENVALLRTNQIKKRLLGVTALLELLKTQRDPLANDADYVTALMPDVVPCLRENNFKVAMTSLEILEILLQRVPDNATRAHFKTIWTGLVECLGDSKLQVRQKAVDVVVKLTQILGVATMFDRLRPCIAHKNWRTREQTVHALWRCLEQMRLFNASVKNEVLDDVVLLLEDSAKEVRDAAMQALEKFYEHLGPSLMYDLENKKIRSGHMKTLTDKFAGAATSQRPSEPVAAYSSSSYASAAPVTSRASLDTDVPMSSTARFLTAIKNKEYDFNNINSTVEALIRPTPSLEKSPSQTSTGSNKSQSASVNDASSASDLALSRSAPSGISDRDIQREMAKIADGLRLDNDWSVRVESLKNLQRLTHKCNHSGSLVALAQGIRSMREVLNEQVVDLRSSVAREACQTLQTLAKVLKDDFNPNAEYFTGNLMKATYVTILVISTASDASIRGIIESTKNGYTRLINKFIEGAKTRNQVLRLNCVSYLTLTLERWNVVFLSKHLDLFLQILPPLLHDALAEVRAQARKCFWALHRLFAPEADALFEKMDPSTQKNLRDDVAAREKRPLDDQEPVPPSASGFSSSGRFLLRKDSSSGRTLMESTADVGAASTNEAGTAYLPPFSSAAKVPASSSALNTNSSNGAIGPRRVLGGSSQPGENGDQQRSFPSRVLGQGGAMRVGMASRSAKNDDEHGSQSSSKPIAGPLRVLKTVDRPDTSSGGNQNLPPVPRAQRVQVGAENSQASNNESSQSSNGGPVPHKDRQNGPKRRALTPEAQSPTGSAEGVSSGPRQSPNADETSSSRSGSASNQRDQPAPSSKSSRPAPAPIFSQPEEGFDDALARIENGLWSVRLEAVELIDRTLERSTDATAFVSSTAKEKKMDERVLLALIRHLADAHYRVAQAALKALQSCLRVMQQPQVAPFLKTILPRLFQKLVDSKESTRIVTREILEFFVANYDACLLVGYVIQQLTDGTNMKMKAAVCHYVKDLLPGSSDYIQQSPNNAHMRGLLTKLAQLQENDAPVTVSTACGDVLQVACSLYPNEVESALPLLAPSKRSTLTRVLRARGIVLSLTQGQQTGSNSSTSQITAPAQSNQRPPPPPPEVPEKSTVGRKRLALSPSKFAASPQVSSRKENEALGPAAVAEEDDTARVLDYGKLSSLSEFAAMLSSNQASSPEMQFEDLLSTVGSNNVSEADKLVAYQKMSPFLKSGSESFWERFFPRVLSALLEGASERDVNAIRVLQRVLRAQPRRGEEFFHPILIGLLDSVNGRVDLAAHLSELTLTEIVRGSTKSDRVLDLLMPLVETRDPPGLQVVLHLVRTVLERVAEQGSGVQPLIMLRSAEWNSRLLASLVAKLQHASSDVRKRTVDCLVAYHFATNEDTLLSKYLEQHVDATKQKLVDIFIQRKRADRERVSPTGVAA